MDRSSQALTLILLLAATGLVWGQTPPAAPRASAANPASGTSARPSAADRTLQLRLASIDTSDAAFNALDTDHDGRISALEAANEPKVAAAFTIADRNRDGYLSKSEFQAIGSSNVPADVNVWQGRDRTGALSDDHASYPGGDRASYPSGDRASYPTAGHASYPTAGHASYPSGDRASEPSGDEPATSPTDAPPHTQATPHASSYPPR